MFSVVEVKDVTYSQDKKCIVALYEEDGRTKCAACTKMLSIKVGDKIEIFRDDDLNYKGYNTIALHHV